MDSGSLARVLFGELIAGGASSANRASIPSTQTTPGDGTASIALGFPPETFVARAAGGEPPRGQDMNGLLNLLSQAIQVFQAGYLGPFDATFAQSIGGYPAGAIVSGSVAGTFWVSTADVNVSVPGATGATWQSLFNGYATEAWAKGQFLQLAAPALQTVTGPVAFSGATTVPDITDFTGKNALNAEIAEGRYQNKSTAVTTNTTTSGTSGRRADGIFITTQNGIQQPYAAGYLEDGTYTAFLLATNPMIPTAGTITGGTYTKTPLNDGTGRSVLVQSFTVQAAYGSVISLPITMSSADYQIELSTAKGTASNSSSHTLGFLDDSKTTSSFVFTKCWLRIDAQFSTSGNETQLQATDVVVRGIVT